MKYNYNFCSNCGEDFKKESDTLYVCPKCEFRIFINPKAAAGVLLFNKLGQLLLVRRSYEPAKGKWSLVGGFIDRGETNEEALQREIKEEVGLEVNNFSYFGSYTGDYLYKGIDYKVVSTFYKSILDDDAKIVLSDEASEYQFVDLDKLKTEDIGVSDDTKVIADLINESTNKQAIKKL